MGMQEREKEWCDRLTELALHCISADVATNQSPILPAIAQCNNQYLWCGINWKKKPDLSLYPTNSQSLRWASLIFFRFMAALFWTRSNGRQYVTRWFHTLNFNGQDRISCGGNSSSLMAEKRFEDDEVELSTMRKSRFTSFVSKEEIVMALLCSLSEYKSGV